MKKWFNSQSRLVQLILLIIPFVNWVVEMAVRWDQFLNKKDLVSLIMALIATLGGGFILGILDFVWVILNNRLFLCE